MEYLQSPGFADDLVSTALAVKRATVFGRVRVAWLSATDSHSGLGHCCKDAIAWRTQAWQRRSGIEKATPRYVSHHHLEHL